MKKYLIVLLLIALCFTSVCAKNEKAYDFQGDSNKLKMLTPEKLTFVEETDDAFINKIDEPFPLGKDIAFGFTMTAGMNNFDKDNFQKVNMNLISALDAKDEVIATDENKLLKFDGFDEKEKMISIVITADKLKAGEYKLVFDKGVQGNNAKKTLGKAIVFEFEIQ